MQDPRPWLASLVPTTLHPRRARERRADSRRSGRGRDSSGSSGSSEIRTDAGRTLGLQPCVLLVDDNAVNRRVGQRLLEKEGYAVEVSEGGREALDYLSRARFDLVLMDVQMPDLDGLETTRALRLRGDSTPIVALTANALVGDRELCLEAGMNEYLTKPLDLAKLRDIVERVCSPGSPFVGELEPRRDGLSHSA